jgi:hypothetical protein
MSDSPRPIRGRRRETCGETPGQQPDADGLIDRCRAKVEPGTERTDHAQQTNRPRGATGREGVARQ